MSFSNYLNNLKIRTKLVLLLILPALVLAFFVTGETYTKWQEFQNARNANQVISFSSHLATLIHELQKERGLSAGFVESGGQNFTGEMQRQRSITDEKIRQFVNTLEDQRQMDPAWLAFEGLASLQEKLGRLSTVRTTIDLPDNKNNFFAYYSEMNALALNSIRTMDGMVNITPIANQVRQTELYTILLWLQERSGQERAVLNKVISSNELTSEQSREMHSYQVSQEALMSEFSSIASAQQLELMREKMTPTIVTDVNDIRENVIKRTTKTELLDRLQIATGYGGLIYDFKNNVIQGDEIIVEHFYKVYRDVKSIIQKYRNLIVMGGTETEYLDTIETTVDKYHALFSTVLKMKHDGKAVTDLDEVFNIDDGPALNALLYLQKEISDLDAHRSWAKTSARIELLKDVSDDIRIEMARSASKFNDEATYALSLYLALTLITIVVVSAISYLLLQRLVGEVISIATTMRNMQATGKHDTLLVTSGKDEIGDMASAFNDLIIERNRLVKRLQLFSRAVESTSSVLIMTDLNGSIEYVNPKFTEVTGYDDEEVMGENPRFLKSGESLNEVYADLWRTILSGKEWKGEFHNRKKDGSFYWARTAISGMRDSTGTITHFIGIQEDMTSEYELAEQLSHQASHDALTGLINRREFERRAGRLLNTIRQDKDEHALCYLDLDQFKIVNDTCGHNAGDELLRQLAKVLQDEVRSRDTLARLGGDEFAILMEHCSLEPAQRVATSLQNAIHDFQFAWKGQSFRVGVSIGLVAITEEIPNLTELLKQADAACYMAKDLGRGRIHVYHPEDAELAQRHGEMQWVVRIPRALEEKRFCLYAQAIVPLDGSDDVHYELLIRMRDEQGKIIPPGAFLSAAERYNLMTQLDRWVVEEALTSLARNPVFLGQINFISINLSGQSLADETFQDFVTSQFHANAIPPDKVCFEITETAAISNLSTATTFISTLKEFGCCFALDDFGSGLSSFGYLKNLPVDYLKIDGMFVKDIVGDPIDRAMVRSINEIGQVMGMKTIAEFVENEMIKGMLKEIGVNYAQGYGIAKPLPFDEILARSQNVINIDESPRDCRGSKS